MSKFVAVAAVVATATLGYAAYFDYQRRNSAEFRKTLKKKAIKHNKRSQQQEHESKKSRVNNAKAALEADLAANPIPTAIEEKELYFMEQLALGERLALQSDSLTEAAICFYKALAVYPNPTDILGIYQRSVPEDVYEVVVMMIAVKPPATVSSVLTPEKPTEVDLD